MKTLSVISKTGIAVLIFLNLHCRKSQPSLTRPFYMAVTPWPSDFTPAAIDNSYAFINDHCDMVSHHFDEGIPYEEAYQGLPWPLELRNDVARRKQKTAVGKKILLSVAPLNLTRKEKADYYRQPDDITDSIKNTWHQLAINDPKIVTAYTRYVSYLIDELHPQFVNYGVESNHSEWNPAEFALFKDFIAKSFTLLKAKYPNIPFFVSFMVSEDPAAMSLAAQLLPYTDYITLSAYPYISSIAAASGNTDPKKLPADFFTRFINLDAAKPWAFAETGYNAQDLNVPAFSLNRQGTATAQRDYLDLVCTLCNERKARFLVWFCSTDYDAANARFKQLGVYQDLFGLWQDTGLTDENNQHRPSYTLWLQWMARRVK